MSRALTIKPPQVKTEPQDRPEKCPHCRSIYLHRHGYSTKPVKDHQVRQVVTVRYKCARCSRTFRHYPSGVTRADQSQRRPRSGAAVAWALVSGLRPHKFGAGIGKSTALRDVRTVSEQRAAKPPLKKRKVRVLGLDGTLVQIRGQEHGVLIALDLGTGQPFLT
jgi:transposase-like protein